MADILATGFEMGDLAMEVVSVTANVTLNTANARTGTYCAQIAAAGTIERLVEEFYTANTAGATKHLLHLKFGALPTAERVIYSLATTGDARQFVITLNNLGILRAYAGSTTAGTLLATGSTTIVTGQYYDWYVEFDCTTLASSSFTLQIDGATELSASGFTIATAVARYQVGTLDVVDTAIIYVDDVRVVDGATTIDRAERCLDLAVASDADTTLRGTQGTGWDTGPTGGLTGWQMVDETPSPNDATDYVSLITASSGPTTAPILDFGLADPAAAGIGSGDTIVALEVNVRHAAATASNKADVLRLKSQSGGTVAESASLTYGGVAWLTNRETAVRKTSRLISRSDPQDGSAWTRAKVATAVVGVRAGDATPDDWISKLWVTVVYVAAVGGGGINPPHQTLTFQAVNRASTY